jgi:4-hydroxybenzoate polyprenyltransferase
MGREGENDVKRGESSLSPPSSDYFFLFILSFVVFIVPVIYSSDPKFKPIPFLADYIIIVIFSNHLPGTAKNSRR